MNQIRYILCPIILLQCISCTDPLDTKILSENSEMTLDEICTSLDSSYCRELRYRHSLIKWSPLIQSEKPSWAGIIKSVYYKDIADITFRDIMNNGFLYQDSTISKNLLDNYQSK
jgi:hypothetical protein